MEKKDKVEMKQQFLRDTLSKKNIKYSWNDSFLSILEAVIARGDEKISKVIYTAWKLGAKFDSWNEQFNKEAWEKAIEREDINLKEYIYTEFDENHKFPWDNIFHGVDKDLLRREYVNSLKGITTPKCSLKCSNCGVTKISKCKFQNNEEDK